MRVVTFDTESDGFADVATRIWCASAVDHSTGEQSSWIMDDDDYIIYSFLDFLNDADVLCGHHLIGHDLPLLHRLHGWKPKPEQRVVDTLLMSRLQRPERRIPPHCPRTAGPHSVHSWGYRLGHFKVEHDEWDKYSPEMLTRCEEDVRIQRKILAALEEEGSGENWGRALRLTMELFTYLREQEETGFAVDRSLMEASIAQLYKWIARIDKAVIPHLPVVVEVEEGKVKGEYGYVHKPFKADGSYAAITERFLSRYAVHSGSVGYCADDRLICGPFTRIKFRYTDLGNNAETKDFLLKSGWVPDQWNTNNAGQRTSPKLSQDEDFTGVEGSLGKLIVKRVQCRHRKGQIEGWVNYLDGSSHWSRPRLPGIVHGMAVTGRARHKLVVNVPGSNTFYGKRMRSMFVATPGWDLIGIDSVGNQVRQLAARMEDDEFTRVVLDDSIDIHSYNQHRAGIDTRHKAKTFFYALIFGAGNGKIARDLGITGAAAKQLRVDFMAGMPAMQNLLDRLLAEWERNRGWIKGLDDRPIFVPAPHMLLVYLLQSDEAIQMAHAYCRTHRILADSYDHALWRFVLWIHDEYQIESDPSISTAVKDIGCEAIAWAGTALGIPVPHAGAGKIGRNWNETH